MNIVILVSYSYPYQGSGIGDVSRFQAEELAKKKHKVTLISSNFPKTKNIFTYKGVTYIKLPAVDVLEKLNVPVPICFFNLNAIKAIKECDILHTHDVLYPTSLIGAFIAKFYNKRVIVTMHILHVRYVSKLLNLLEHVVMYIFGSLILSISDQIIIINKSFYNANIIKKYTHKVIYIPNGIDKDKFFPVNYSEKMAMRMKYNLPPKAKILLFVGRFVPKKGYDLLLNAQFENILLLLIGDTKNIKIKKNQNIYILGRKSKNILSEYYKLSDAFVLPSHSEGFPLSIQEAMQTGLPIFAGRNNDYTKDMNGKYFARLDYTTDSIAKKIINVMNDNKLMAKMSDYSIKVSSNFITWKQNVSKLESIYKF